MRRQPPTGTPIFDQQGRITPMWMDWFGRLWDYYQEMGRWVDPKFSEYGQMEPTFKEVRLIAYSDGSAWDPEGQGVPGYYEWDGTQWVSWPNAVFNLEKKLALINQGTWIYEIEKRLHQIETRLAMLDSSDKFEIDKEVRNTKIRLAMSGG